MAKGIEEKRQRNRDRVRRYRERMSDKKKDQEREKDRQYRQKIKEKGVKDMCDLSSREQRVKMRQWKKDFHNYELRNLSKQDCGEELTLVSKISNVDINQEQIKFLIDSSNLCANILKQALETLKSAVNENFLQQSVSLRKNNTEHNDVNSDYCSSIHASEANIKEEEILPQQNDRLERYRNRNIKIETRSNFQSSRPLQTGQTNGKGKSVFNDKAVRNENEHNNELQSYEKTVEVIKLEPELETVRQEVFNTRTGMVEQAVIVYSKVKTENIETEDQNVNIDRKFVCHVCGASYLRMRDLKLHMKIHPDAKCYSCETHKCDQFFRSFEELQRHKKQHCQLEMGKSNPTTERSHHFENHMKERSYPCSKCPKAFHTSSHLKEHMYIHSDVKQFQCHLCAALFSQKRGLRKHLLNHMRKEKFICVICKKTFCSFSSMKRHKNTAHHCNKIYPCKICGRPFALVSQKREHEKKQGTVSHPCQKCNNRFHDQKTLKIHEIRTHTGDFPYFCGLCGRGFISPSNAKYHVAVKHSNIN